MTKPYMFQPGREYELLHRKRPALKISLLFVVCVGLLMASRKEPGSVPNAAMASTAGTLNSSVKQIQIDGLVGFTTDLCLLKMPWKNNTIFNVTKHRF